MQSKSRPFLTKIDTNFPQIQQTFTYSNSIIETLEKGMKYIQS